MASGALTKAAGEFARGAMTKARSVLQGAVPVVAHRTGLANGLGHRYRGAGIIFMLHSVVDDARVSPDQTLRCPVSTLEMTLRLLHEKGIEIVSLDEVVQRLSEPVPGRFAAFTFDDGFDDNLTHALPVMERYAAPFTVYVATGMITGEIDAWWLSLAELIWRQDRIEIPGLGRALRCPDPRSKRQAFAAIEALIHRRFAVLPAVRKVIEDAGIDSLAVVRKEALSLERLRQLAGHPLVTIGAHGTTHTNLALLSDAAAEREMAENRAFLERALDRPVRHFAYPFGHAGACGPREARLARKLGFETAVTTRNGSVFPSHAGHPHALPRERLYGGDTRSSVLCKVNGFYRAVRSRLGSPIADLMTDPGQARSA